MSKTAFPTFLPPMTAESAKTPFDAPDWIFEIKLDGYRAITVFDSAGKPHLWSRNGLPLEMKFPAIAIAVSKLKLRSTILDGEVVAVDENGIPRFQLLQRFLMAMRVPALARKGLKDAVERMKPLFIDQCPFVNPPNIKEKIHWVRPTLVCEVEYAELTDDDQLRQTTFLGWRDDKNAKEVVLELIWRAGSLVVSKAASSVHNSWRVGLNGIHSHPHYPAGL